MKKTPSVFLRNPENMHEITRNPNPEAQWVFDGEGVATRKYDGTCVMFDGAQWWARREVKKDKPEPPNWLELDADPITGKRMGWEPIEQSGLNKHLEDALSSTEEARGPQPWKPGTYELCGPKINGNPEGFEFHVLIKHEFAEKFTYENEGIERDVIGRYTFNVIRSNILAAHELWGWEGLVWHHPDGRMAKLKARDFKNVQGE